MGYSVSAHFASPEDKQKMSDFLQAHFKPYKDLVKGQPLPFFQFDTEYSAANQIPHDNLGYDKHKLALGFNLGIINQMDNYYLWKVLQWMALRLGDKVNFNGIYLPVVVYDGNEKNPVFRTDSEITQSQHPGFNYTVDNVGWSECPFSFQDQLDKNPNDQFLNHNKQACQVISQLVKEELNRLEGIWQQKNP